MEIMRVPSKASFNGSATNKEKLRKASVRVDANPAMAEALQQNMSAGPKLGL